MTNSEIEKKLDKIIADVKSLQYCLYSLSGLIGVAIGLIISTRP